MITDDTDTPEEHGPSEGASVDAVADAVSAQTQADSVPADPTVDEEHVGEVDVNADVLSDGHLELGEGGWLGSSSWRRVNVLFGLALILGVAMAFAFNLYVDPLGISKSHRYAVQSVDGVSREAKARLMAQMKDAPGVLLLGSSTSRNADPKTVEDLTGAPAFNAGMTAGKPVDMYAMASYAYDIWQDAPPHIVYLFDVDVTLRDTPPNGGLLTTPELWKQFNARDKARIATTVWRPYLSRDTLNLSWKAFRAGTPYRPVLADALSKFRPDGFRTKDPYEGQDATARRRAETLRYRNLIYANDGAERLDPRGREYIKRIVALANSEAQTPTIVVLPPHPAYRAAVLPDGYDRRREAVIRWLHQLRAEQDVRVIDMTNLSDFGGKPQDFSDHVHMTKPNMDRLMEELHNLGVLLPAGSAEG